MAIVYPPTAVTDDDKLVYIEAGMEACRELLNLMGKHKRDNTVVTQAVVDAAPTWLKPFLTVGATVGEQDWGLIKPAILTRREALLVERNRLLDILQTGMDRSARVSFKTTLQRDAQQYLRSLSWDLEQL